MLQSGGCTPGQEHVKHMSEKKNGPALRFLPRNTRLLLPSGLPAFHKTLKESGIFLPQALLFPA